MLGIDAVHGTLQDLLPPSCQRSDVGIAELYNAIAIKGGRQILRCKLYMADFQLPDTHKSPIKQNVPKKQKR